MTSAGPANGLRIGLVGTFDVSNFGDCLFTDVHAHLLRQRFPDAEISLHSPYAGAAAIMESGPVLPLPATAATARMDHDVLILAGGETLSVGHGSGVHIFPAGEFSAFLRLWLAPLLASQAPDTRFIAHCVGMPRQRQTLDPLIARLLASADRVRLRDAVSNRRLGGQFGTAVDPCFLMAELDSPAGWEARARALLPAGLSPGGYLVAQVSQSYLPYGIDGFVAALARIMRDTGWPALLLPICLHIRDDVLLALVRDRLAALHPDLAPRVHLEERVLKVRDTAALLSACAAYVGSSLHGAVAGVAFARPMAILSKHLEGKHAQTLLSAGVDGLVTDRVEALPELLALARGRDLEAAREEAMARARADHALMCDAIAAPRGPRPPIDQQALATIIKADRASITSSRERAKRLIFTTLRRVPPLWRWLEGQRLRLRMTP